MAAEISRERPLGNHPSARCGTGCDMNRRDVRHPPHLSTMAQPGGGSGAPVGKLNRETRYVAPPGRAARSPHRGPPKMANPGTSHPPPPTFPENADPPVTHGLDLYQLRPSRRDGSPGSRWSSAAIPPAHVARVIRNPGWGSSRARATNDPSPHSKTPRKRHVNSPALPRLWITCEYFPAACPVPLSRPDSNPGFERSFESANR